MMKNFFKFLIGLFLIPLSIGFSVCYIDWISNIKTLSFNQKYFLFGLISYLIIHLIFRKPFSIYVLGHELSHALLAKLFGGEVKDLKVSSKGGEVKTTKSNFLITLAPYIIPLYTLIIFILFWIVSLFLNNYQIYMQYFLFLVGFSISFHILLTVEMIRLDQPDIKEEGFVFSISLIYFTNLLIISGLTKMIFLTNYEYSIYFEKSLFESKIIYENIYFGINTASIKTYYFLKDYYLSNLKPLLFHQS